MRQPFRPKAGSPEVRLRHLEAFLSRYFQEPAALNRPTGFPSTEGEVPADGGGGGTLSGVIPESQVVFDDAAGHRHAGSGGSGTPITLLGDVTGPNTATVVGKLQTRAVGAGAPNVGDLLIWDGSAWTPTAPTVGNNAFQIGGWHRPDISALTFTEPPYIGSSALTPTGLVAENDGIVTGIGISLSGDVGGVGDAYNAELYLNGVATGWTVSVTGAAGTQDRAVNISTTQAFIRTDKLTFHDSVTGAPAAVAASLFMMIEFT